MDNTVKEILDNFPLTYEQITVSKNRTYFRWSLGWESVEVQIPGFKIGKRGLYEKRPWIIVSFIYPYKMKTGRTGYKQITSSHVYDKTQLRLALKELNRRGKLDT